MSDAPWYIYVILGFDCTVLGMWLQAWLDGTLLVRR